MQPLLDRCSALEVGRAGVDDQPLDTLNCFRKGCTGLVDPLTGTQQALPDPCCTPPKGSRKPCAGQFLHVTGCQQRLHWGCYGRGSEIPTAAHQVLGRAGGVAKGARPRNRHPPVDSKQLATLSGRWTE